MRVCVRAGLFIFYIFVLISTIIVAEVLYFSLFIMLLLFLYVSFYNNDIIVSSNELYNRDIYLTECTF